MEDGERGDLEEVDAAHSHGQCGSRELQVFQSDTYTSEYHIAGFLYKRKLLQICTSVVIREFSL